MTGTERGRPLGAGVQGDLEGQALVAGVGRGRGRGGSELDDGANNAVGRGRGRGGVSLSVARGGEAWRASMPVVTGFATGEAGQGGSRGPEVPLPVPTPHTGKPNDGTNIWCHGKSLEGAAWRCGYCGLERKGGGATRFKQHLAGMGVDVNPCATAPHYVVNIFRKQLPEGESKRRRIKEGKERVAQEITHGSVRGAPINIHSEDEEDPVMKRVLRESFIDSEDGRSRAVGGNSGGVKDYFDVDLAYSKTRPQQTIEACLKGEEHRSRIGRAWAKWFQSVDDIFGVEI